MLRLNTKLIRNFNESVVQITSALGRVEYPVDVEGIGIERAVMEYLGDGWEIVSMNFSYTDRTARLYTVRNISKSNPYVERERAAFAELERLTELRDAARKEWSTLLHKRNAVDVEGRDHG
jgi:hypothetical protein